MIRDDPCFEKITLVTVWERIHEDKSRYKGLNQKTTAIVQASIEVLNHGDGCGNKEDGKDEFSRFRSIN